MNKQTTTQGIRRSPRLWAVDLVAGSAPTFISAHDDDLARDMACFLWECSRLRYGLFTPPEFIPLVSARLREYLTSHKPNTETSQPRGQTHE